jgi:hypothetical protein
MDTAKDKERLDELHATGKPPWYVWNSNGQAKLIASLPVPANGDGLAHIGSNGHAYTPAIVNNYRIADREMAQR